MTQNFFDPDTVNDRESFMRFAEWLIADRRIGDEMESSDPQRYKWGGANGWQNRIAPLPASWIARLRVLTPKVTGERARRRRGKTSQYFSISGKFMSKGHSIAQVINPADAFGDAARVR